MTTIRAKGSVTVVLDLEVEFEDDGKTDEEDQAIEALLDKATDEGLSIGLVQEAEVTNLEWGYV